MMVDVFIAGYEYSTFWRKKKKTIFEVRTV